MRFLCGGSSVPSSRSTWEDISILYLLGGAMPLHSVPQGNRGFFTAADAVESAFSKVQIFQIGEVFENRLADVEGFGATGAARQLLESFFNGFRKAYG